MSDGRVHTRPRYEARTQVNISTGHHIAAGYSGGAGYVRNGNLTNTPFSKAAA